MTFFLSLTLLNSGGWRKDSSDRRRADFHAVVVFCLLQLFFSTKLMYGYRQSGPETSRLFYTRQIKSMENRNEKRPLPYPLRDKLADNTRFSGTQQSFPGDFRCRMDDAENFPAPRRGRTRPDRKSFASWPSFDLGLFDLGERYKTQKNTQQLK